MATRSTRRVKTEIETAIAEAKTAVEGGDADAMKAKTEALAAVAMKMGQAIYEKTAGRRRCRRDHRRSDRGRHGRRRPAEEEVVDAEFSEVDDDKKA